VIDFWGIIEWLIAIVVGIPLLIVIIIPTLVYLGARTKRVPSFTFLLNYFEVDITKPPYSDWMERSAVLFIGMTSLEIYTSWYLIKLFRGIKWVATKIVNLFKWYVKRQWKQWDDEFAKQDEEEKRRSG
jgi:ABC-type amino acid transport system permease subunit